MKLSQIEKCFKCGEGLAHSRLPLIVRFEVQTEAFDQDAIMRAHGMEQLMNGNVAIARIMGVDEEIARPNEDGPVKGYVCLNCAMTTTIGELAASLYLREPAVPVSEAGDES